MVIVVLTIVLWTIKTDVHKTPFILISYAKVTSFEIVKDRIVLSPLDKIDKIILLSLEIVDKRSVIVGQNNNIGLSH
jgi:hypothetical protein